MIQDKSYGILAVIGIAGMPPECDETHFDGWYAYRRDAEGVFGLFKKRYPHANVFIVEQVSSEWRGMEVRMPDSARAAMLERYTARCDATGT